MQTPIESKNILLVPLPSSQTNKNPNNTKNDPFPPSARSPLDTMHSLGHSRLTLARRHPRTKLFLCPPPRRFFFRLPDELEVLGVFGGEFSREFIVLRTVPFSGFGGVDDAFGRGGGHASGGICITCLGHCQKGIGGGLGLGLEVGVGP